VFILILYVLWCLIFIEAQAPIRVRFDTLVISMTLLLDKNAPSELSLISRKVSGQAKSLKS
jgi:hypothetical protein